ncbi:class I SAM-dependent methyltransferase [Acidovorax facilis]|uniref:class I SAM-dependent methyltransferase n=1 Tax=Acidovorax facilis TaxID=12917 RepID=UPI003CE98144
MQPHPPPTRRRARTTAAPAQHNPENAGDGAAASDSATPCLLQRAHLRAVPSTLLIPLAARARGSRYFPWLACNDVVATSLVERLGADVEPCLDDLPTVLNVLWRTRAIKDAGRSFFLAHPKAGGVSLGCGLSHHFQWLDTGANQWLDADLPEVMDLRRELLPVRCPRTRHATVDITQPGWWQRLGLPKEEGEGDGAGAGVQPVFIVCEGVLMYLQPAQVQAVLREFAQCAPEGSRLVIDVMTHRAVGRAAQHASVGPTGAEFHWGVGSMDELTAAHPRLALLRQQSVSECYGWPGVVLETLWWPWLGAPLYGMATLGVDGA